MTTLYDRIGGHVSLEKLLHQCYSDVRQHKIIGLIFNERILDWPKLANHLQKIVAGESGLLID